MDVEESRQTGCVESATSLARVQVTVHVTVSRQTPGVIDYPIVQGRGDPFTSTLSWWSNPVHIRPCPIPSLLFSQIDVLLD